MSIIGGGGFFADLRNWRDDMQEELMVVTFEAEVKTPESSIALSWRYQVEVSICPMYSAFALFKLSGILCSLCTRYSA